MSQLVSTPTMMMNNSCPMSPTSSWAIRVMMDMCGTMAWSTTWTVWVVVSVAMAWTTSPARWVIVNPFVLWYIFGFCANSCAMNRGIFGVFGVLCASAFHLKKLDCRGIVILLEGGSQIILTGLAAHTEQAGQQRYNEDTTYDPQGNGARASRAVSGQRGFCCPASTSGCNFEPYKRFSGSCDMMLFTY